jgi:DNA-binding transcriptional LysR family regulator
MLDRRRLSTLPLGALRAFEAASRQGSFKAAAAELGVTPAAVSHQIKALEAHLGQMLFERLNRALRLTQAGTRLAAVAQQAFASIEQVLSDLESGGLLPGPMTLTISAAPSFASKWLVPRLHRFQAWHPKIDLRLLAGDALLDLTNGHDVDIALRYGSGNYGAGIHAERLWDHCEIFPVCASALIAQAPLEKPADLLRQSLLRTAAPAIRPAQDGGRVPVEAWQLWFAEAGIPAEEAKPAIARGPHFSNTQLSLDAAAAGRGVALAPGALVADDLATGRLARPFAISATDPFAFWLAYAVNRANEARIRAFARWVREEAAAMFLPPA